MPTNWISTAFRELKHILWKIDQDEMRYLKEPKLHTKPCCHSFFHLHNSQPGGKDVYLKNNIFSRLFDTSNVDRFTRKTVVHPRAWVHTTTPSVNAEENSLNAARGFFFLSSSRLINGRLWKHRSPCFFTPKYNDQGYLRDLLYLGQLWYISSCSLARLCVFLQREWVLCKASTHSGYVGADQ